MAGTISIPERQLKVLRDHALEWEPDESCAILYGGSRGGDVYVRGVFLADNADRSPDRFAIAGDQLIAAYGGAERAGMGVVGIFHSHPASEARPSETDMRFMEINPVTWVIYSGADGAFRAFVLDGGGAREVGVVVAPAADPAAGAAAAADPSAAAAD